MPTKEKAPVKNKSNDKSGKWTKVQLAGFWSLIVILGSFWAGTYIGTQATLNSQAHEAQVKSQAIQEYKAEQLKVNQ